MVYDEILACVHHGLKFETEFNRPYILDGFIND